MVPSAGQRIDGLGKTPIVDQVGEPCPTQTARQCVVESLDDHGLSGPKRNRTLASSKIGCGLNQALLWDRAKEIRDAFDSASLPRLPT